MRKHNRPRAAAANSQAIHVELKAENREKFHIINEMGSGSHSIEQVMQPDHKPEPGHPPNGPHQRTTSNNAAWRCLCCGCDWHK